LAGIITTGSAADAAPIVITIGDNDGFGFGAAAVPDGGNLLNINLPEDRRSAAEAAAIDGAQQTDFYSANFNPLPQSFDIIFPLVSDITSGSFTVDMGGFQALTFGQLAVSYNGVAQPGLFNFEDGAFATAVRTFVLDAGDLAAANLANEFRVTINRVASNDAIAFDFFRLDAETAAVPEPVSMLLLGIGGIGALVRRRRTRA
jgi:hypothetical protein